MARILFAKPVSTFAEYTLQDNEHPRSPRLGGWGAPPMEILR
jgi:hypothetical protein